jgi:hypothetical protein
MVEHESHGEEDGKGESSTQGESIGTPLRKCGGTTTGSNLSYILSTSYMDGISGEDGFFG